MAQSVKFHGKYKGVIVARTDVKKLRDKLNLGRGKLIDLLVENMSYIGEAAVKIAREQGDYNDITGNLRSSIGYIVLSSGKVKKYGAPIQKAGKSGDGSVGVKTGNELLKKLQTEYPYGVVLVLCAGMEYAALVENVRHKHVLIDAELEAQRLIDKLLGGMLKRV